MTGSTLEKLPSPHLAWLRITFPRWHRKLGCLALVSACGFGTMMFTGIGLGPPTYEVVVENGADREFVVRESIEEDGAMTLRWNSVGSPRLAAHATSTFSMFYKKRGRTKAQYKIGFFDGEASDSPSETIVLRSADLDRLDHNEARLMVREGSVSLEATRVR